MDRPIVIVCTGASRRDGREGWHDEQPVQLAEVVPVLPRADLALMAELAGTSEPEATPDTVRGYGVRATLGTMTDHGLYLARMSDARIVDGKNGPVLMLPACPRCHERGRRVAKAGESRRGQRGAGARVAMWRVFLVAEHFPEAPVNVAMVQ